MIKLICQACGKEIIWPYKMKRPPTCSGACGKLWNYLETKKVSDFNSTGILRRNSNAFQEE